MYKRLGIAKMAAPMVITRVIQLGSKNSLLNLTEKISRICSCSVQRRTYYDYDYELDISKEDEEVIYKWSKIKNTLGPSPLKEAPWPRGEWVPKSKRCGLLAIKLGMTPIWTKEGERLTVTALQVVENNVISYTPPEENKFSDTKGYLIVGARNANPLKKSFFYSEQFKEAAVPVKDHLAKFNVTPNAKLQPGTPLFAGHFRPGMYVDCRGRTIDKGFQGVMKRWGMKGQPASHGATKTHRKMGASGGGGTPGKIWPGKKMPGHMGDKWQWTYGLKIWRVNTKYNIIYVNGSVCGTKYGYVKIIDTILPKRNDFKDPPPFPTYYEEEQLDKDLYHEDMFEHTEPSIQYEEEEEIPSR
ncbi:large ribosomal subunit protein uL3m-like [Asterias amurensis]|uniref:large ribosomal subunit protein uL3m-like n=1 Tax=Asterias amurensis TaxID=7602 RepID=UPI003AB6CEAC